MVLESMLALSVMATSMISRSRPRVGSWVLKPGVQGTATTKDINVGAVSTERLTLNL